MFASSPLHPFIFSPTLHLRIFVLQSPRDVSRRPRKVINIFSHIFYFFRVPPDLRVVQEAFQLQGLHVERRSDDFLGCLLVRVTRYSAESTSFFSFVQISFDFSFASLLTLYFASAIPLRGPSFTMQFHARSGAFVTEVTAEFCERPAFVSRIGRSYIAYKLQTVIVHNTFVMLIVSHFGTVCH